MTDYFMSKPEQPEPEVRSEDELIEAIFTAADARLDLAAGTTAAAWKVADRQLADAIDEAMSHAYAEGRADQLHDMREAEIEKAARLMNETGQGEHMGLVTEIERIWNLPPKGAKRAA